MPRQCPQEVSTIIAVSNANACQALRLTSRTTLTGCLFGLAPARFAAPAPPRAPPPRAPHPPRLSVRLAPRAYRARRAPHWPGPGGASAAPSGRSGGGAAAVGDGKGWG